MCFVSTEILFCNKAKVPEMHVSVFFVWLASVQNASAPLVTTLLVDKRADLNCCTFTECLLGRFFANLRGSYQACPATLDVTDLVPTSQIGRIITSTKSLFSVQRNGTVYFQPTETCW